MRNVNVNIPDHLEPILDQTMAAEGCATESDFFLSVLKQRARTTWETSVEANLLEAHEEFERGEYELVKPEMWERLRANLHRKNEPSEPQ